MKSYGQVAYEGYASTMYCFHRQWGRLSNEEKTAWNNTAQAVLDSYKRNVPKPFVEPSKKL